MAGVPATSVSASTVKMSAGFSATDLYDDVEIIEEVAVAEAAAAEDAELLAHLMLKVGEIARAEGLAEGGFRTVMNTGADAGQTVPHLHIHIIGGRSMQWPPG